ncbi:nucleoside diphosphate kinase homolog 7-like [Branchiostoma floridae x Branchiostoma belcheri]
MSTAQDDRYSFIAEWYDPNAALMRRYQFLYYPKDNSIEMFDIKNHRTFLKRTKYEGVKQEDLYIGSTVEVFSRQLCFVDYGDNFTAKSLGDKKEKTLAMIKPDAVDKMGLILDMINQKGLLVTKAKMVLLSRAEAAQFYIEHQSKPFFNGLLDYVTAGPVVAMELMGSNAIQAWRDLIGPTNPSDARSQNAQSLRAKYGTDNTRNAAHGSDSKESAMREAEFFFPSSGPARANTAQFTNCTCCVIKPHAVLAGQTGKIIQAVVDAGYEISALQMFHLERANAEEFIEVYKGVVAEYNDMVSQLCAGPSVAMEIRSKDGETPQSFREFVGPADPEIARHLRPRTLRAIFGADKIQNAVHCTDLPEDGLLEVEYFFKILDS